MFEEHINEIDWSKETDWNGNVLAKCWTVTTYKFNGQQCDEINSFFINVYSTIEQCIAAIKRRTKIIPEDYEVNHVGNVIVFSKFGKEIAYISQVK